MTTFTLPMSPEGAYLAAGPLQSILRAKAEPMLVRTDGDESIIKTVRVRIAKTGREYIADKITGGLYDPQTGRCPTSTRRVLVGPVPEGYQPKRSAEVFEYGYQQIGGKKPKKPDGRGKARGASKGNSKLTEERVRKIREKRPGSVTAYVLSNTQCQEMFGVSKGTVDDVRRGRTWGHVK